MQNVRKEKKNTTQNREEMEMREGRVNCYTMADYKGETKGQGGLEGSIIPPR
jgi:hypothetical protein